jgi:acetolactate synthase regulatory subunit
MNTTQKSYRFCIEPDEPIATLEAVLAIVRRLGIELRSLRTTGSPQGLDVQIRLAALDEDPLTLCRMRLHNVVGILAIREMPPLKLQLREPRRLPVQHDEPAIPAHNAEQRQFTRLGR